MSITDVRAINYMTGGLAIREKAILDDLQACVSCVARDDKGRAVEGYKFIDSDGDYFCIRPLSNGKFDIYC